MKFNPNSRRHFLQGAGGFFLAIPLLPSLVPRAYAAATAGKRFFCLGYDNGRHHDHWNPTAQQLAGLTAVNGIANMRTMPMANIPGNISQIFGTPFNGAIRTKMSMIHGLDGLWQNLQGHQTSTILAGNLGAGQANGQADLWETRFGPSADYVMARNLKSNPNMARATSYVNLGVYPDSWDISFRYNAANNTMANVGRETNPLNTFNNLFGGTPTATPTPVNDRQQKVVDMVYENYTQVVNSPKLALEEKQLLQEHIQTLSELQTNIRNTTPVPATNECVRPTAPTNGRAQNNNGPDLTRINNLHVDLMVTAAKCGIVNIGTILLAAAVDNTVFSNLGITGSWHNDYSHNTMDSPQVLAISQLMAGFYGRFINGMNVAEPGTNGTYLDNSLVMFGNAMGNGTQHSYDRLSVVLAGSLGGRIQQGRYIDYANLQNGEGRNYCSYLAMLLTAMGLAPADYQQPNVAAGFGSDTVQGNPSAFKRDRSVLPGIIV